MLYCDLHCDLLRKLSDIAQWTSTTEKENYQISPDGLRGGIFLQTFAVFAPDAEANMSYFEEKRRLFEEIKKYIAPHGVRMALSVENGAMLEKKAENVERMALAGVKMLGLVWNGGNALGGSHGQEKGLTPFGKEVVARLAAYGVLPDVSHLSDKGFFEVAEMMKRYKKPFVASHSNARALCSHTRNLTDEQIRAVAECGGVIGVNFYPAFLGKSSPAEHIAYIIDKGGEAVAAIGSDFDGIDCGYYKDCVEVCARLETDLKRAGLTARQIEKVIKTNALRTLDGTP